MLSHCSKSRKNTENVDPKVLKTENVLYVVAKNYNRRKNTTE